MKRTVLIPFLLLAACGQGDAKLTQLPAAETASARLETVSVQSAEVQRADIERPVRNQGTTEPVRAADLGPQMTARVNAVLVKEGDTVKAGQPLVKLDMSEAELRTQQSAANATSMETQYAQAKAEYERLAPLVGQGSITQQQIDRLAAQRDALKSSLDMAKVAQASAKRDVTNTTVRAPFAGIVSRVAVEAGEVATMMPVKVLVRLVDLSNLDVRLHVHERELSRIAVGNQARASFPSTGESEEGTIIFISPEIDPKTRTAEVVVRVDNPKGTLRAGMFSQIDLRPSGTQQGLIIPTSAVGGTGEDRYVFTIVDGTAQRKKVRVAAIDAQRQEVLEGLTASDIVVTEGIARLSDGLRVASAPPEAKAGVAP